MDNEKEDNGLEFSNTTPKETTEGTMPFGSQSQGVPSDAITNRAAKYSFALGNSSPGQEEVANQLSTGQEDQIRKHQMAVNQLAFEQQKSQMIGNLIKNSPDGIDADSADFVRGLQESDYRENPDNVMETTYGRRFMSSIAQRDQQQNFAKAEALHPEYANQTLDIGEQAIARNEIVHREIENIHDQKKQQGLIASVADFAMANLLPLASVRLRNVVGQSPATSLLPGSNMQEQIGYLRSLDSDQFQTQFTSALKSIPNLDLREQFATAVLQQSDIDASLTNLNTLGDIATVAQIAAAPLKGLVKGVVSSETHAGLAGVVKSAITASKSADVSAAKIAATTGDFREAAVLNMLRETTPGLPAITGEDEIRNKAFSLFDGGQRWFTGDGPNLAGPNVRDFSDMAKKNDQLAANYLLEAPSVDRTSPAVRAEVARTLYDKEIVGRDGSLANAVLDVDSAGSLALEGGQKFATHLNPLTNTESITVRLGRKNGEQFPNKASAVKFAKDNFGLLKFNQDQFVSTGGKWHIRLDLDLPDHIDNMKDIEIPANDRMSQNFFDGMIGGLLGKTRNQSNILGDSINQARSVVVHGNQKLFKVFQDIVAPIANLNSKERTRLGKILEANRDFVDRSEEGENRRGVFFKSRQDFELAYHDKFGALPSQKEVKAYYSYVQANQLDGMVRNAGWARDRIRLGIHKWNDRFWNTKPTTNPESLDGTQKVPVDLDFHGKQVFSIPEDEHETSIAIRDSSTGNVHVVNNKRFMSAKQKELLHKELNGKAVIIQAESGHLTIPTATGDVTISHYVTATSKRSRVSINGPWKDGGHIINEHEWYVKQPIYKGNYYAGDLAVATARTEKIAKQRAESFSTARDMMLRGDPNLDRYVSENIGNGWDGKTFAEQFGGQKTSDGIVSQGLDTGGQFLHTRSGERTIDRHKTGLKHGENPYNILQMDRTFAGERDATNIPALIDEKGVRHIFEDGRILDPWQAMTKAAGSMTNVKLKRDYVLKSANLWVSQFKDILEDPTDKLRNDAVSHLYEPRYVKAVRNIEGGRLFNNAENARKSIIRLIGSENKEESLFALAHAKLGEMIGEKAAGSFPANIIKNPAQFAKQVAYSLHLGLLAPSQFLMQAQSLVSVLSISPRAGLKGMAALYPLRYGMVSEAAFENSVGHAARMGWNPDQYREMGEAMMRSGWAFVHGDQAILDTINQPKIFTGKVNKMIDWGNLFVTEGVRAHRIPAYATAYQEWRWANPVAKFDRAAEHSILKRADDLSVNMSASNNAVWQRGLASVPMQFATFPLRLMETYFGKSLTKLEKMRQFAGYSMFYGIPTAVGGVAGVFPAYECIKNYLLENNIPHDDDVSQAVLNGLPQVALRAVTGSNVDVGKRFGQGGIGVAQEGLALLGFDPGHLILNGDKDLFDLATGASGSTLRDFVSTSVPFVKALWSATVDDPKDNIYPLDTTTVERAVRNITSANSALKLWYALNTGRWMSKYDMVQDEVTPMEGVLMGLTGASLERIDDIYATKGVLQGRKDMSDKASLEVMDYLRRGLQENDDHQRQQYMTIAKAHAVAGGLTEEEWSRALRQALQQVSITQKDATAQRLLKDSNKRGLN